MDTQGTIERKREAMVANQLERRGIRDEAVRAAVRRVERDRFVPRALVEFAYEDTPLPIEEEQTISQPFIVALMAEMLELKPGDRVLEVGTGSGYAAAILAEIVDEVYTVERHESLAKSARKRLEELGYDNIYVRHGDGTKGWPDEAPFDAIVVTAGGPEIPQSLRDQLAVGGRLVIPVGQMPRSQELIRLRRTAEDKYEEENLGAVAFVPLIGEAGWVMEDFERPRYHRTTLPATLPDRIAAESEPFDDIPEAGLDDLLSRIDDARVVLLGEASHGTDEFYEMRAHITKALIEEKGFNIVAVEADWPDAAWIDRYVRDTPVAAPESAMPFSRFPTWMWANTQVLDFIHWLREYNQLVDEPEAATGFFGLDLYSLHTSVDAVITYLDDVDEEAAAVARTRYGCLSPWEQDAAAYGAAALSGNYEGCEEDVLKMLEDLLQERVRYTTFDGERYMDAMQNARLVANAERYYRIMYYGSAASWNLRDQHMFDTLQIVLGMRGPQSKAVVWAHNSHVGDARATEMGRVRQEHNIGQLARQEYGDDSYHIGFGTDCGTVAAASEWGGQMEVKTVRPSHKRSYEHLCHTSGVTNFLLPLRHATSKLSEELSAERLERAIGVIYRPETEMQSHYFFAKLPNQFDEYIWLDKTQAVTPLTVEAAEGMPDTFPFGV
ncbi:MAG: protein-L-isoaspartate(D-aspartate) O-methyltransferase [Chloroflexota bacterium]|jgi:protein-L-isoaspartate(D-aspartate) O-methyltransferase